MKLGPKQLNVCVISGGALVAGQRVAVRTGVLPRAMPGLIACGDRASEAVHVAVSDVVPEGVLAVSAELSEALGLAEGAEREDWSLVVGEHECFGASLLVLEPTADTDLERAERHLVDQLASRLFWWGPGAAPTLDLGGTLYRVHEVHPPHPPAGAIYMVQPTTDLRLLASAERSGVDVVILADRSGSMSLRDLTGARGARISRMEAVRSALDHLFAMRIRTRGRGSRFALVAFDTGCEQLFPPAGGMAELDGDASPVVVHTKFMSVLPL